MDILRRNVKKIPLCGRVANVKLNKSCLQPRRKFVSDFMAPAVGNADKSQPTDMPDGGMKVVHLRDPEENLFEIFTPLKKE